MGGRKSTRGDVPRPARSQTPESGRPARSSAAWAALILGLLTVLFFHQLLVGGKTFVSPDTTAPVGFVRMGEQSLWKDHVYPLWNPYVFLGMPSFASGAYNPLIYPPDWPLALLNRVVPLPDMGWMILYYFLGGLFTFLLARELGARAEGALLGATAFVFAPNLVAVGSHGHGSQLVDSAYLPLMLWLVARWMRCGGIHHLAWLALTGGFQLLRGHVQICFYTWIAIALYVVVDWAAALARPRATLGSSTARALGVAVAAGLAFGLAGFYNLPLREYAGWSVRGSGEGGGIGVASAVGWSLAPIELPSVVVPGWAGFGGETYWGGMPFTDYPNAYVGMVAALLALPAFLANGPRRIFALFLASLSLLIAFGRHFPLYGLLYDHLPLFNKFRIPVMIIVLFQLAVALGAAWGWSAILPGGGPKAAEPRVRTRRVRNLLIVLAGLLVLALAVGVMGPAAWRASYIDLAMRHRESLLPGAAPYSREIAGLAWEGFVSGLGRACLLGLLLLGVAGLLRWRRLSVRWATAGALVLLLADLWPVSGRVMAPVIGDAVPRRLDVGRDDVVESLERAGPPGTFRILPLQEFATNRFAGFGIASVGGNHPAKLQLIQDFLDAGLGGNLDWMNLLNVRYLVMRRDYSTSNPPPPFLRAAHKGPGGFVYLNTLAMPRATLAGGYAVVRPGKAILDSVRLLRRDMSAFTYLEQDPQLTLGPVEGGRVRMVSYRLNDVTVDVETPGPALLRLADLWYPGWTARVDGRPAPVLKADYLLRAVHVPAGRHRVVFRFESPSVRLGLRVSLLSLFVVLAGFGWSWWTGRGPGGLGGAVRPAAREEVS